MDGVNVIVMADLIRAIDAVPQDQLPTCEAEVADLVAYWKERERAAHRRRYGCDGVTWGWVTASCVMTAIRLKPYRDAQREIVKAWPDDVVKAVANCAVQLFPQGGSMRAIAEQMEAQQMVRHRGNVLQGNQIMGIMARLGGAKWLRSESKKEVSHVSA